MKLEFFHTLKKNFFHLELTVTKMDGTSCDKNGGAHHGKKWVELTLAKMGGAHHGKNGWNWC